ncbi:MAG: SPOR domain-containing protein [Proteobacteria bacterium]|uniref:SPOR domain-containing protein n=1 Tax=Candidatus Avisuccinivibrio stercorigallinarum TaxID=2840704 RepID=A0A9D9DDM5_9GAMM|nr:SPOR domain-containing protein [Candidatus Avisuccinivibrio stercorigallinarum]
MSVSKKLRNRIVGGLIIFSLLLLVLPALMEKPEAPEHSANEDIIAVDENGALTDSNGNLLSAVETDYATLLAPEDDMPKSEPQVDNGPLPSVQPSPQSNLNDNVPGGTEILTAQKPQQPAPAAQAQNKPAPAPSSGTEILRAPAKQGAAVSSAAAKPQAQPPVEAARPAPSKGSEILKAAAGTPSGAYTIQVGVFSQTANAENVVRKLKAGSIPAYTEKVTINGKNMVRVYAGSADSREALQQTLKSVETLTGAKGKIVKSK